MKKSDAVKLVTSMVKNFHQNKDKPSPTFEQFATAIINTLQDCGMSPPEYDSMPGSDWVVNKREWENENA